MKQMLIIIHLIILTGFGVNAQNKAGLIVTNYKNNNSKFISEGTKIHVIKDGRTYKGTFKVISDQIILVNSDTIRINQVQELSAKKFSNQLGGGVLMATGVVTSGLGLTLVVAGILESYVLIGLVLGGPIAAVGVIGVIKGVKILSRGKRFGSSKWAYHINIPKPELH